ncbi:DUF3298 and DUF4163 domain-containing protein [Crassaminicella profunda]|uniref:DUF3298 and DUF4163 domain-containing protein n=1 Tax=Crassaminicella profunda TaxID=1286698 RepID=UPI001CA67C7E|nr:DUF3298 and DUF4163 domain-containing protein [Crassaminicella profunda]QZY53950.1 DUF3298 and DUF4163 domain-containing protein [Crassaminicella profunda]
MKKIVYKAVGIMLILSLCISTAACSLIEEKGVKAAEQTIKNQPIEITAKEIKVDEEYIKGDIKIPVISKLSNKDVEERINELFENDITEFMEFNIQSAKNAYDKNKEEHEKENITSDYEVAYKNENLISIIIKQKVNEEKPYTHPTEDYYNIDLNTGKQIAFDRLFNKDEDYNELLIDYIKKEYNKKEKDLYMCLSNTKDVFYYLRDQKIIISFNPYDAEEDHFEIPFSVFKNGVNTHVQLKPYAVKVHTKKIKENKEYFEADVKIPVLSGLKDEKIQEKINQMFKKEALDFKDEIEKWAKEGAEDAKKYDYEMRPYSVYVDFEEKKNEQDLLSIYITYYEYTGGAHGMHNDITYNIDLKTGKLIELKDLFKENYDYEKVINEKIKEQIDRINKPSGENSSEDDYIYYQGFEGIRKDHSFYLKDNKLGIYFGLYEIAPYAAGIPTFEIPLSTFENGLKEDFEGCY